MQMFKDMYAKNKTGAMAYNIGIMLANEAKTNPALTEDAVDFLLDASFLDPKRRSSARTSPGRCSSARTRNGTAGSSWPKKARPSSRIGPTTINKKFGEKSEEELTPDEKPRVPEAQRIDRQGNGHPQQPRRRR